VRIFKTKWFARFARKERISPEQLREAIQRAEAGNIDANLGGHLIKQRINRTGQGRSGGYRSLIAYHDGTRSIFLYGFAKSQRDNIDEEDLSSLKKLAAKLLVLTDGELQQTVDEKELSEVQDD
jgi:hypothetical protein